MQAKKIICRQCGATLAPGTAKCPYCGSAYAPEAEREYMRKLDEIREDLDDVGDVGADLSRKEIGRSGKRTAFIIGIVFAVAAAFFIFFNTVTDRHNFDNRQEYAWRQEHLPEMDRLFEEGKYEELVAAFESARDEGHDLYEWEHYEFCTFREDLQFIEMDRSALEEGSLSEEMAYNYLYDELRIRGLAYRTRVPEKDRQIMEEMAKKYENDLVEIFHVSAQDLENFDRMLEKNDGYVSYDTCRNYIKDHPEILNQ